MYIQDSPKDGRTEDILDASNSKFRLPETATGCMFIFSGILLVSLVAILFTSTNGQMGISLCGVLGLMACLGVLLIARGFSE